MENVKESRDDFFVKIPLQSGLRIMEECGHAFKLLLWIVGRTTIEFQVDGFRVGAVLGFGPHSDSFIARDMAGCGVRCTDDKVFRWRQKLASKGLIAQVRTPYGHRLAVMYSVKFPGKVATPLPHWARAAVSEAFGLLVKTSRAKSERIARSAEREGMSAFDHAQV